MATSAPSSDDTDMVLMSDMVLVSEELSTFTYYDPTIGAQITAVGVETVYVDQATASASQRSTADAATLAGGCAVTKFMSNVGRGQSSTAPYTIYATGSAYVEVSSGCTFAASVSITLRERLGLLQPELASAGARAGVGTRRYASVSHACVAGRTYFLNGSTAPYTSPDRKVC